MSEVFYESKQDAYERFQEQFASSEIADNITVDDMQESFRAKLVNPEKDYNIVASAFEGRPGVENVVDMRSFFDTVFNVLNGFQVGCACGGICRAHRHGAADRRGHPGRGVQPTAGDLHHASGRRLQPVHPAALPARGGLRRASWVACWPAVRWCWASTC